MASAIVSETIESIARGLEVVGVVSVAVVFAHASVLALRQLWQKREGAYERLKTRLGRALLLGLEFLVAADIIRTVTIDPTRDEILSLGLLIVVRLVLGWSIAVEIEGCWPWKVWMKEASRGGAGVPATKE